MSSQAIEVKDGLCISIDRTRTRRLIHAAHADWTNDDDFFRPQQPGNRKTQLGALAFTPLWLLRNGFIVTFVVYVFSANTTLWPLAHLISLFFFFRGSALSWGNGTRWLNLEEFADSQYTWSFAGKIAVAACAVSFLVWLVFIGFTE